MNESHRHNGINWSGPGACLVCRVEDLESENERLKSKVTDLSDEAYEYAEQVETLKAENARLREALWRIYDEYPEDTLAWKIACKAVRAAQEGE